MLDAMLQKSGAARAVNCNLYGIADLECRHRLLNLALFAFKDRRNKRPQRVRCAGTARSKHGIIGIGEEFRPVQPGSYFQPIVGLEILVLTLNSEDFDCPAIHPTFQVNDGPGN